MAALADAGWARNRPDPKFNKFFKKQTRFPAPYRLRLESRRRRQDGAAAVPRSIPVLRRQRQAFLPDVPAQRGPFSRRAVQHRLLRRAHADGRPSDRSQAGRIRADTRRRTYLSEPPRASARATHALTAPIPEAEAQSGGKGAARLPLRRR